MRSTLLLLALVSLLLASAAGAHPDNEHSRWVHNVRQATEHDDSARACALPRVIQYQSTLALVRRAELKPQLFSRAVVVGWRLRLLALRREAAACLGEDTSKSVRAQLVVDVELPPTAAGDRWYTDRLLDEPNLVVDDSVRAGDEGAWGAALLQSGRPPVVTDS